MEFFTRNFQIKDGSKNDCSTYDITCQLVDDADDPVHAVGLRLQRLAEEGRREKLENPHHFETSRRAHKMTISGICPLFVLASYSFFGWQLLCDHALYGGKCPQIRCRVIFYLFTASYVDCEV